MTLRPETPARDWALRIVLLVLAALCLWRLWLYLSSSYLDMKLSVEVATFTFMPVPDAIFALLFGWFAIRGRWRESQAQLESGIIVAAIHVTALLGYGAFFNNWTDGRAFSFGKLTTYLYGVGPAVLAALFLGHLVLLALRRRRQTKSTMA